MLDVFDDIFTVHENEEYRSFLLNRCTYRYGECDHPGTPPTGLVCDFTHNLKNDTVLDPIIKFLKHLNDKIYEKNSSLKEKTLYRVYLNLFLPNEKPYFHIDGHETVTCLYYLNPILDCNEGGETQFLINGEIKGIISKPGRLVIFNGDILHRATSFKSHPRLTLAFKFK
jgi:hypothetical protein